MDRVASGKSGIMDVRCVQPDRTALRPRRRRLARAGRVRKGAPEVHRLEAPLVENLLESADKTRRSASYKRAIADVGAANAVVEVPPTLQAEPRPYQLDGFR